VAHPTKTTDPKTTPGKAKDLPGFLRELTEVSRRYGLAIAGPAVIFEMESDDYERAYRCEHDKAEFV
jgi:hypothetical protein